MYGYPCGRGYAGRASGGFFLSVDNLDLVTLTVECEVFE